MSDPAVPKYVHRYTKLRYVEEYLARQEMGFRPPDAWEDKNDSYFLSLYGNYIGKDVYCCCFTSSAETFHHWRIFSEYKESENKEDFGARMTFDHSALQSAFNEQGVTLRQVKYVKVGDLGRETVGPHDLPYVKRIGFADEREYRAIVSVPRGSCEALTVKSVRIPLPALRSISLSPFCPDQSSEWVRCIRGNLSSDVRVGRSRLIDNARWRSYGEKIARRTQ
jgi:hypothetical protein